MQGRAVLPCGNQNGVLRETSVPDLQEVRPLSQHGADEPSVSRLHAPRDAGSLDQLKLSLDREEKPDDLVAEAVQQSVGLFNDHRFMQLHGVRLEVVMET